MGKFSIVQPSLIQQLKSILDQYQDDGQILKELIQNAEDAQATVVKFLLDERCHSARPEMLHHPDLAQFQGPALYSYNDAYFTDSDWTGLKMLGDSIKKDDPLKVGRFGLGFKSVFHITDLPSVLSGDRLCMLDPHERYFLEDGRRTTGYSWHLRDDREEALAIADQFAPFADVFGDGNGRPLDVGRFAGTLFRFPLRQRPSALSDSTYDARKVEDVFRAFQTAAEQVLVFLTSVERVELYRRRNDSESVSAAPSPPELIFRVQVAPSVAAVVRDKRRSFVAKVREATSVTAGATSRQAAAGMTATGGDLSLTFRLTIERTVYTADSSGSGSATYLVSHYCRRGRRAEPAAVGSARGSSGLASHPVSSSAAALQQLADELGYLPWASVAALLPADGDDGEPLDYMVPTSASGGSTEPPRGQLFCFLPLPLQRDSPTGLPVHVSGFFAVSSNRHQVKWPSTVGHGATDRACLWNERLADEVVPRAYAALLLEAVTAARSSGSSSGGSRLPSATASLTRHAAYALFPDPDLVVDRWRRVLPVLFDVVLREPVFFVHTNSTASGSTGSGGRWERAERTLAPDEHDDLSLRDVLARCLAAAATPTHCGLALVPAHVLRTASVYLSQPPQPVTPAIIRQALRRAPSATRLLSDDECLTLLEYVLRDEQYDDLAGVPLLPVSDGTFVAFATDADSCAKHPVYVPTEDHPAGLLPQIPKRFLDVSNRVDDKILNKLKYIAYKKKAQLRAFNEKVFAGILRSLLKADDVAHGFYGEILWEYLHKHFSKDLSAFDGLPLLLAAQEGSSDYLVLPLRKDLPVLALKYDEFVIGNQMATSALHRLDVAIINEAPLFVCNHPHVRNNYVFQPTAQGILSILCTYVHVGKIAVDQLAKLSIEEKRAFRGVLSRLNRPELLPEQLELLESMPIFEVESRPGIFTSVKRASVAAPLEHPPLPEACVLLDVRDTSSQFLADLLAVSRPSRAELFIDHLMPIIREQRCSRHDTEAIMTDVLQNLATYYKENQSVMSLLASLPFVHRQDGAFVMPSRVFDPESDVLQSLLYGQKLFPSPPYDGKEILVALRRLGLGSVSSLSGEELLGAARRLSELVRTAPRVSRNVIVSKFLAMLTFLEEHHADISDEHLTGIQECEWIVPLETPVPGYPSQLPWYKPESVAVAPSSVVDISHAAVVGSCAAVLPKVVTGSVRRMFGWDALPDLELILRHLQNVVANYRSKDKGNFLSVVCSIYDTLQLYDPEQVFKEMQQHKITRWVWHGDGFAAANNIVLSSASADFRPYIFVLPPEVEKYSSLFNRAGAHESCNDELLIDVLLMIRDKYREAQLTAHPDEAKQDLQLSLEVLERLASSGSSLPTEIRSRLVIPAAVEGKRATVNLVPVEECTYCESEWLNQRRLQISADEQERITFVHPSVSNDLAERLGVPSLVNRMLNADKFEIGEGFGQSEPLTRRLRNLLQEYSDGFAVPKELIQNADDAGATEVKFLYDERRNEDALTCLIDDGMKDCQGPALWVYNNAVFTDDDFDSIIKLSGATKAHETEKIGGFGLGFNAVYNLTDVPSFVSRHYVVIFDPHTTHLGRGLADPSKPGLKIDLDKNSKALRTLRNQFKPYNGIYGCELMPGQGRAMHFDGTLFRLPLRSAEQAARSEISDVPYDRDQMKQLFQLLARSCSSLLLFTQHVRSVSVHYVPQYGRPTEAKELFSITKEPIRIIRELKVPVKLPPVVKDLTEVEQEFTKQSSILKASANVMQLLRNGRWNQPLPQTSLLLRMLYRQTSDGCHFVPLPEGALEASVPWLVVSCMGSEEALNLALAHSNLSPTGGVAVPLEGVEEDRIAPHQLVDEEGKYAGRLFCYLPLPINTGLPVHINGAFAVSSSRRHLLVRSMDDKQNNLGYWNEALMKDTIAKAYVTLLEDIRDLMTGGTLEKGNSIGNSSSFAYHHVWPLVDAAADSCLPVVHSLYARLAGAGQPKPPPDASSLQLTVAGYAAPRLFSDGRLWVDLGHTVFLDPELRLPQQVSAAAAQALRIVRAAPVQGGCGTRDEAAVVDVPSVVERGFVRSGCADRLQHRRYDIARLYKDVVFPVIARLPDAVRDPLMLFALDCVGSADEDQDAWLRELLTSEACIPVTPDGRALSHISVLVNPVGPLACLYAPGDGRFPHGSSSSYLTPGRLATLVALGMQSADLSAEELLARASASADLCSDGSNVQQREAACQRAAVLIRLIDRKLAADASALAGIRVDLRRVRFLPCALQSGGSQFGWQRGDESPLWAPDDIFPASCQSLLSFVEPILDEAALGIAVSDRVKDFLGLNRPAPIGSVLSQLRFVAMNERALLSTTSYQSTKRILHDVYQFLQVSCTSAREECDVHSIVDGIKDVGRLVLVGSELALPEQVAAQSMHCDCSPYLYELPFELRKYEHMFRLVGMRDCFTADDFAKALESMQSEYGDQPLSKRDLQIALNLAGLLNSALQADGPEGGAGASGIGSPAVAAGGSGGSSASHASVAAGVYLPDSSCVLRLSSTLCFNDCPWLPDEKALHFVHNLVPYEVAKQLGVNTKRQETLRKVSSGIPFGQKEKLTKRLRRIMSVYPCGKEIFKELVQNADDAGATVVHFVRDCRNHPAEKVFEDCWKPLQGPALCVYNNRPFSKNDLEGIQNLGDGSKGRDPNKTGQYGVGFNSVYHLTDVPSFLTCGPEVGELLCVFDPHCSYVPGATMDEPGRMYNDVSELRRLFPDVFSGYLESLFNIRDATIFRFPLRNADMAEKSRISNQPVTLDAIGDLMTKFKNEMFDSLLFINNVTEISISDIPKAGSWKTETYTVRARLSAEDSQKRREFSALVGAISQQLRSGQLKLTDITSHHVCYTIDLEDSTGYRESWLVLQKIGFDNASAAVSPSVLSAFATGDMCLLPRGGVACLLQSCQVKGPGTVQSVVSADRPRRAFCFLPLPIATKLPVHVNGHFALDHEARRGLWKDDDGGARTEWNTALIDGVIAPAYLSLLEAMRSHISAATSPGMPVSAARTSLNYSLDLYHKLFPAANVPAPWDQLSRAVYRIAVHAALPMLPLIKEVSADVPLDGSRCRTELVLNWLPVSTEPTPGATYLNTLDDEQMTGALLACGMRLVSAPLDLCGHFDAAGVPVCRLSAADVTSFLLSDSCQLLEQLPCSVGSTAFGNVSIIQSLASYCRNGDSSFWCRLEGLPLGVAQDGNLRRLSADDRLFVSGHRDLVPSCSDLFLHAELLAGAFADAPEVPVFRQFTVEEFGIYIHQALPEELCCDKPVAVPWYADQLALPNRAWLVKVWDFLAEQCTATLYEVKMDSLIAAALESMLYALHQWALIPAFTAPGSATTPSGSAAGFLNRRLVPIRDASTVVDLSLPVTSPGLEQVRAALRRLSVLELDAKLLEANCGSGQLLSPTVESVVGLSQRSRSLVPPPQSLQLIRLLTASLSKPYAMLKAVRQAVEFMPEFERKCIKQMDCEVILRYFSDALTTGQLLHSLALPAPQCQQLLRELPFYVAIDGRCTDLGDKPVFLLPPTIPAADFDVWQSKAGVVFLQKNDSLEPLYAFLGCQKLTDIEVYCRFIFESFLLFSSDARIAHLAYIRDRLNLSTSSYSSSVLKLPEVLDEERNLLLSRLRDLPFIDGSDGMLRTPSAFYDPDNHLFQAMFERTAFPPYPFDGFRWIRFLRLIGLRDQVSDEEFLSFAQQIATQAKIKPEARLVEQSKILVRELFMRPNLATSVRLLKQLSEVPFISAASVGSHLMELCPQCGFEQADSTSFIPFCGSVPESKENVRCAWSNARFLPHWADPLQQKQSDFEFEYPHNEPFGVFENYREEIVCQLGILPRPTVVQVVDHLKKLGEAMPAIIAKRSADSLELVLDIMKAIYRHLQDHMPLPADIRDALCNMNCVIVESGRAFVRAEQLVLNFYEEQQIKPYLQRAPPQLAEFQPLLRHLGATERATIRQYAAVLQRMYDENSGERLHPNSLKACYKAVKGLVTLLSQMETCADVDSLYLPSQDAYLLPSNVLVYNDEPAYAERLQLAFDQPFLVDLRECHLQISYFGDVARKLPAELRPRMLANIVEECLDERSGDNKLSHGPAQILRTRLSSSEFTAGILRLIRHEHLERGEKPDAASLKGVRKALKNIRVYGVEQLVTYLKYAEKKIYGSEIDTECFVTKELSRTKETCWAIYVQMATTITPELLVKVAEIVNKIAGGLLHNSIIYLHPLLMCNTYDIESTLDKLRIRQDHHSARQPTLLPPGSFVPLDLHHQLSEDIVDFEPGEYVGYELDDPVLKGQAGSATYIYAVVIEEVADSKWFDLQTRQFYRKYRINIGDDKPSLVVPLIDLYRLRTPERKKAPAQEAVAPLTEVGHLSLNETFNDAEDLVVTPLPSPPLTPAAHAASNGGIPDRCIPNDDIFATPATSPVDMGITPGKPVFGATQRDAVDELSAQTEHADPAAAGDGYLTNGAATVTEESSSSTATFNVVMPSSEHVTSGTDAADVTDGMNYGASTHTFVIYDTNGTSLPDPKPRAAAQPPTQPAPAPATADVSGILNVEYPELSEATLAKVKVMVEKQVRATFKLEEVQRNKVLKRIMLKFHPDKNIDKQELCTDVMQSIRGLLDDLEQGGFKAAKEDRADWWSEFLSRRAKTYGQQQRDFEHAARQGFAEGRTGGGAGSRSGSSQNKFDKFKGAGALGRKNPQPAEARRWFKQAGADARAAVNDMDCEQPSYEWVCFKCHQAAEKALKGALYTFDSRKNTLTDLKLIAGGLFDRQAADMAKSLQDLVGPASTMCFPDSLTFPRVPHDIFTRETAEQAMSFMKTLIEYLQQAFLEAMERELRGEPPLERTHSDTGDDSMEYHDCFSSSTELRGWIKGHELVLWPSMRNLP